MKIGSLNCFFKNQISWISFSLLTPKDFSTIIERPLKGEKRYLNILNILMFFVLLLNKYCISLRIWIVQARIWLDSGLLLWPYVGMGLGLQCVLKIERKLLFMRLLYQKCLSEEKDMSIFIKYTPSLYKNKLKELEENTNATKGAKQKSIMNFNQCKKYLVSILFFALSFLAMC